MNSFLNQVFGEQNVVYIHIIAGCCAIMLASSIYLHFTDKYVDLLDSSELRQLYLTDLFYFNADAITDIPTYMYTEHSLYQFLISAVHLFTEDTLSIYFSQESKFEFSNLYQFLKTKPSFEEFKSKSFSNRIIYSYVYTIKRDFLFLE